MTKLKPLSQEWVSERNEMLSNEHSDHFSTFISLLHTSEVLIEALNRKRLSPYKMDELQFICSYHFAHTYHMAFSIFHLTKLGFGSAALVLHRSMVEALINLSYLWLCKKINKTVNERMAWSEYVNLSRNKMDNSWKEMQLHRKKLSMPLVYPERLFDKETSKKFAELSKEFKTQYNREHWAIFANIEQRARKVDDTQYLTNIVLEQEYQMTYRWTSEFVHGMGGSADAYYQTEGNSFTVDLGANFKNVDIVLPLTSRVLLIILSIVERIYHLNIDLPSQVVESGFKYDVQEQLKGKYVV